MRWSRPRRPRRRMNRALLRPRYRGKKVEVRAKLAFRRVHARRGSAGGAKQVMSVPRDVNAIASCVVHDAKQRLVHPVGKFFAALSGSRMRRQF